MATQKPISTISYNTEAFLVEKLDSLVANHTLQAYTYICHKGEDGDKDHIHLRVEPNKKLDPMDLTDLLKEYDPKKPDKPLCVRPWRPSKEEDWILYVVHHKPYLDLKYGGGDKGEKLPYSWEAVKSSEFYDIEVMWVRALAYMEHTSVNLATKLQAGTNPIDLIMQGEGVFMVNALSNAIFNNQYARLKQEHYLLENNFNMLRSFLETQGFTISYNEAHGISEIIKNVDT